MKTLSYGPLVPVAAPTLEKLKPIREQWSPTEVQRRRELAARRRQQLLALIIRPCQAV